MKWALAFLASSFLSAKSFAQAAPASNSKPPASDSGSLSIESGDIRVKFEDKPVNKAPAPLRPRSTAPKVLDFDGVVIEGERQRPGFFLDVKSSDLSVDEVIYTRSNFDDYYSLELNKSPRVTP